jgi:hypothetical protein
VNKLQVAANNAFLIADSTEANVARIFAKEGAMEKHIKTSAKWVGRD